VTARLFLKVPILPTESPERVRKCISNIFGEIPLEQTESGFAFESSDAERFLEITSKLVQHQRILDASRRLMRRSLREQPNQFRFMLNKQAAFVGVLSFVDPRDVESIPLGVIEVQIETSDPEETIDRYFPKASWLLEAKFPRNK